MMSEVVFRADEEVKAILKESWLGERVMLEAILAVTQPHPNPRKNYLTTKVEDVTIVLPNKERHHLSHTWLQKSEAIKDVPQGSKIRFTATITTYYRGQAGTPAVGFTMPFNCEVLTASALATAKASVKAAAAAPAPNVIEQFTALLAKAKSEMDRLGGKPKLDVFLRICDDMGGMDNVAGWIDLVEDIGGVDKLNQLLPFLG
jgi:hypothetical protein